MPTCRRELAYISPRLVRKFVQEFEQKCRIGRAANDVNLAGMAKFVGSLRVPRALRLRLASVLLGVTAAACATANDQSIPPADDGSGGSDVSAAGTATEGGSSDPAAGSFGTSGASSSFGGGAAGQSAAGAAGSNAALGGGGSGTAGSSSAGGVSTFGGAPATGGASTGGSTAVGGTASSAGGATGAAGTGSAGTGTAGSTSSAGAAGATGGTGCTAPPWTAGFAYTVGAVVTGVCQNIGGGSTVCVAGKKYPWTCFGSTCAVYQPGADGWWGNWTVGTACD